MSLLKAGSGQSHDGTEEMRENSRRLNETLASFNIDAHIINVTRGPSVTRYEVELEHYSKVINIEALTMLEIDGYVCRQGAGSFLRTVELKEE